MLSYIPNFINKLNNTNDTDNDMDNHYFNIVEYSTKSNEKYKIVRYRKELLAAEITEIKVVEGQKVINQGEKGHELYMVDSGTLK
jgi:hypothetical protein